MKSYDSIDYYGKHWGIPVYAFDKPDGSNIRMEWSPKRGFYKFGTRKEMIDSKHPYFGFAVDLFLNKYGDGLEQVFKGKDYRNSQNFVVFSELTGTKSAFGWHDYGNDVFDLTMFDVNQFKKGLLPPKQFVNDFGHLGIPRIVYQGNLNMDLVNAVKNNEYDLSEGVICKGVIKGKKDRENLYYCKIKTNEWFDRLRAKDLEAYNREVAESLITRV